MAGFQGVELIKNELAVEDYSLQQTSLDDVFIRFARKQHDSDAGLKMELDGSVESETSVRQRRPPTNVMPVVNGSGGQTLNMDVSATAGESSSSRENAGDIALDDRHTPDEVIVPNGDRVTPSTVNVVHM